jgi:CubicO group peptidase (beta-lactamase class C family)
MRALASPCLLLFCTALLLPLHVAGRDAEGRDPTADELARLLEKARAKYDLPAMAAGFVHADGEPITAAVGVCKRGAETQVTGEDEWHLGSNTKPMTALLIAILTELGFLDWDTPLEQVFPEGADHWSADMKHITPAHLLTHTSGLPSNWRLAWLAGDGKGPQQQRERLVQALDTIKLAHSPGQKYEYSNLGYVLLGAIVDRRGKAPWEEQIGQRVFRPLKITRWGLGPIGKEERAVGPWPHGADGKALTADAVMDNPPVMNPAGRVRMTVGDYTRFLTETLRLARGEQGLVKPATAQKMFSNPYPVSPHSLSGWLGFRKEPGAKGLRLGHDGSNRFNYCAALLAPDDNWGVCVLTNEGGPGEPGAKACHEVRKTLGGILKR